MGFSPARLAEGLADLPRPQAYVVAYSGGLDSSVLLHALAQVRDALGAPLRAVHVHHGLHPRADAWAAHCERGAAALDVPCRLLRVRVDRAAGQGPEEAARAARYAAFAHALGPGSLLLTAHHRDDQAETLLLRLLRGAGVRGLAGMAPLVERPWGWLARPLLPWPREALRAYAGAAGLSWIEDPSNADPGLDRNYLRHQVMPLLEARWPGLGATLARAAGHCGEAARTVEAQARRDLFAALGGGPERLSLAVLEALPPHRRGALLRAWIARQGLPLPAARVLDRIRDELAAARADARPLVSWPGGEVRRYRGELWLGPPLAPFAAPAPIPWSGGEALMLPPGLGRLQLEPAAEGLDAARLAAGRLEVGFRRPGLACRPPGRRGHRDLKQLFQERGIPPWLRDRVPLLLVDGRLAAVAGVCCCEPFAAAPGVPALRLRWEGPEAGGGPPLPWA